MNRFGPTIYVVFLIAVFLTIERYVTGPWSWASILTVAPLIFIVGTGVWAHQSQRFAIAAEHVSINPEGPGIPREVSAYYRHAVAGLTPLGFRPVLSYSATRVPNAIGFATLFKNERTSEVATIVNSFVSSGFNTHWLLFRTDFADGTRVSTNNNNFPSYLPAPRPPVHVFTFPQVQDPGRLYEVHQAVVGQFDWGSPRSDPIGDDPDAYVKQSQQREHARFVACGYHYLDETKGVKRLTWKGAFMSVLKLNRPVREIRKLWRWWKAARMLRELGLR